MEDMDDRWEVEWDQKAGDTIEADFSDGFYVWAKGDDFFFVTRSGRLYYSKKAPSGKRKATALWTDGRLLRDPIYDAGRFKDYNDLGSLQPRFFRGEEGNDKNPIRGLIFDADSNRGFAFTRPKPEAKDQHPMYF